MKMSLDKIHIKLKDVEERREKLIKDTRDIVTDCSKSIVSLHRLEIDDAKQRMERAKALLENLREQARTDLYKYLSVPEQELVEAYTLKSIVDGTPLPGLNELNVSGSSYITGILDCIGEMKRMVYDRLRSGKRDEASHLFYTMEGIYSAIYPLAVYDNLVPGLRRKLDVAKMLIEDIRAIITEETRRGIIINAINNLENKLQKLT